MDMPIVHCSDHVELNMTSRVRDVVVALHVTFEAVPDIPFHLDECADVLIRGTRNKDCPMISERAGRVSDKDNLAGHGRRIKSEVDSQSVALC